MPILTNSNETETKLMKWKHQVAKRKQKIDESEQKVMKQNKNFFCYVLFRYVTFCFFTIC